jgi:hypothetical protein
MYLFIPRFLYWSGAIQQPVRQAGQDELLPAREDSHKECGEAVRNHHSHDDPSTDLEFTSGEDTKIE